MRNHLAVLLLCVVSCGSPDNVDDQTAADPSIDESLNSNYFPAFGKGVNLAETETYGTCVAFDAVLPNSATFAQRSFDLFNIKTRSELNEKLNISASAAAKSLWVSALANHSHFEDVKLEPGYDYWVARARYELIHESVDTAHPAFRLSDYAKGLLRDHGWPTFKKACGSQFYAGRTLGAQYTVLYEMREAKARRSSGDHADASASAIGISDEERFARAVARANEHQTLRSHISIAGGDAAKFMNVADSNSLRAELENLAMSLGTRHGRVLEWETLSYDIFPEVVSAKAK